MSRSQKRSGREEAAIAALVSQPSIPHAAKLAGIAERTLYRWLKDAAFQEQYRQARRQLLQHAIVSCQQAAAGAVAVLRRLMLDQDAPPPTRVAAAKAVLEMSFRGVELEDLESRIAALEAKAQEVGTHAAQR
jgi:hypothetical protein